MKYFIFTVLLLSFSGPIWAAEDSVFAEKARTRQYLGGPDETDLKVQAQIQKLQKSKNETSIDEDEGF
jgi:hypothetical protein